MAAAITPSSRRGHEAAAAGRRRGGGGRGGGGGGAPRRSRCARRRRWWGRRRGRAPGRCPSCRSRRRRGGRAPWPCVGLFHNAPGVSTGGGRQRQRRLGGEAVGPWCQRRKPSANAGASDVDIA